ncbi:hypothetical protein X742_19400 [Mesorhizobium sp. LNHC232B00]|nr:hypothetical protein X742_19400 [Mesorhizobium sp. LNHC232B00]
MTGAYSPLVTITLNARGVGVPAQMAAKEVYGIFALAYPAIQTADLSNIRACIIRWTCSAERRVRI